MKYVHISMGLTLTIALISLTLRISTERLSALSCLVSGTELNFYIFDNQDNQL